MALHGARNDTCGGQPPSWAAVKASLPKSKLGTFLDGGKGWRWSGSCGSFVPVRGIVFSAKKKGQEKFVLQGDDVLVVVK